MAIHTFELRTPPISACFNMASNQLTSRRKAKKGRKAPWSQILVIYGILLGNQKPSASQKPGCSLPVNSSIGLLPTLSECLLLRYFLVLKYTFSRTKNLSGMVRFRSMYGRIRPFRFSTRLLARLMEDKSRLHSSFADA